MSETSIVRAMFVTMMIISGTLLQYFTLGPAYYMMLDEIYTVAEAEVTSPDGVVFLPTAYYIFKFAYASFTVMIIICSLIALYLYARRKYYASEGVWMQ